MPTLRLIPWEYGVRNLLRRPGRSALTLAALATVVLLVFVVVGFIRGLEATLAISGDPRVVLVHSQGTREAIEYSSIGASTPELLSASLNGLEERYGMKYVSGELYLGTMISGELSSEATMGLVRGVTPGVLLVRGQTQILEGRWPGPGEVLVGRLAAAKLGWRTEDLAIGRKLSFEGRSWRVSGQFASRGSVFESELWCPLTDLQRAMLREDLSLVAVTLAPGARWGKVAEFCKEQQHLELEATPETTYYEGLNQHYRPVRWLAWLVVGLLGSAGVFAGLNTMHGAVVGRVRELATLQTVGFRRPAIALSLIQEGVLLAAAGSLLAAILALALVHGAAVRFTMGAFALRIDSLAMLAGCGTGLLLGLLGSLPPALHAMRLPIAEGLKAV
jgi:ABC-type antimicrobial peptide transport system permease subunit